ncbi:MAG: nitrogenase iron-molybdenum cofactor biosynthesis protein NifE [Deltaproteobacteria bacterium]|jgi:nitrogenase molybdenum-cofactor synthesis protein NifE|nr:nitrogenase iron-molybdenum cofactor biosynthesis protein NifE [Deltaproteobacteria bacterium]MCL5879918.1 nitrogenase iron-molybdenum cofactor biosynthesis protein NifE [Deltaproteobacteria bacterium]MDA8304319.1 nitrogenase iron-molybdenum cofactor biosynthesis protein NifE [Deltaproteobacteria bacterium]
MRITAKEEYFDEPACEHNGVAKDKKACKTATPGSSTGGCALDGAYIVLSPIKDALNIVHAPINCLGNSYNQRTSETAQRENYYMYGFTTAINENDLIFGSEDKLRQGIIYVFNRFKPKAVFIYNTCVPALTGEDIEGVSKELAAKLKIPVVPVFSQGFSGNKNLGNKIAGDALFTHIIGRKEPEIDLLSDYNINLIGEYNIKGELFLIKKALKKVGINVLSTITGDSTIEEIMYSHKAGLNVVVCSKALIYLARKMKEKYGLPYIEGSFFGLTSTNKTIMDIVNSIGDYELTCSAKKYIKIRTRNTEENIYEYKRFLTGKKALLYTGGVKSWSLISALNDLGMKVIATGVKKSTEEDKLRIKEIDKNGNIIMLDNGNPVNLIKIAREEQVDIILAGGRNQYTAIKSLIPFLDVNQERLNPYTSYEGMEFLAKQIYFELKNPLFKLLKESNINL